MESGAQKGKARRRWVNATQTSTPTSLARTLPEKFTQNRLVAQILDDDVGGGPNIVMSSVSAANTETVVLAESPGSLQQSPPQSEPPAPQDPRDFNESVSIDGRNSDADKMLQSAGVLLGVEGTEGDGVGPEVIDASEPGPTEAAASGDDAQHWVDEEEHNLKRVKVYELIGARWIDQGTAFCFGDIHDNEAYLVARSENDYNQIILSTTIRSSDVYQRQQGASRQCSDNLSL